MTPSADRWTRLVGRLLAPNPGPMTLDGTNSFVIAAPGHDGVVVVDPGPEDAAHLERLAVFGAVELILITHHHADHVEDGAAAPPLRSTTASSPLYQPLLLVWSAWARIVALALPWAITYTSPAPTVPVRLMVRPALALPLK